MQGLFPDEAEDIRHDGRGGDDRGHLQKRELANAEPTRGGGEEHDCGGGEQAPRGEQGGSDESLSFAHGREAFTYDFPHNTGSFWMLSLPDVGLSNVGLSNGRAYFFKTAY
jgi:hypothetical protein